MLINRRRASPFRSKCSLWSAMIVLMMMMMTLDELANTHLISPSYALLPFPFLASCTTQHDATLMQKRA